MIDTHVHLNSSRYKKNRDEVISAARSAGVETMIVPGTDLKDSQLAVELAATYDDVYAAVGIHPQDALPDIDWEALESLLSQPKVVAVGEIGLDAHYAGEVTHEQSEIFTRQLQLAAKYEKPIIIHSRQATNLLLPLLEKEWAPSFEGNIVFHCCESDPHLLKFAQEHGFYLGIDGDITYDPKKAEFIREVPLEMLLLETDSPYLLPEPLRTQKAYPNTPANLPMIAQKVAEMKGISLEEVDKTTTHSARTLFRLQS